MSDKKELFRHRGRVRLSRQALDKVEGDNFLCGAVPVDVIDDHASGTMDIVCLSRDFDEVGEGEEAPLYRLQTFYNDHGGLEWELVRNE